jgi:integrase
MKPFRSFIAPLIEDYLFYRRASGRSKESSYESYLRIFDNYCLKEYPDAQTLSQEMADKWCKKRDTEQNNSCRSRIGGIICFLRYAKSRGKTDIIVPQAPKSTPETYIPHAFTPVELQHFFDACDHISGNDTPDQRNRNMTIPVFFRLLYSSGIRTVEARLLRAKDVNLTNGVLSIRYSKGNDRHFVVLHDTMLQLMIQYDTAVSRLYPDRTYFFPARNDGFHTRAWVQVNFRKLWDKNNTSYATAYELRHHYAIVNINHRMGEGMVFHAKLLCLSKSMGHSVIESTKNYYSLVPHLAGVLQDKTNDSFNHLIPEVYDHETNS